MDNNEKINELKELLAEGILTQEEFDNEMAKLNGDTPKEEYTEKVNANIGTESKMTSDSDTKTNSVLQTVNNDESVHTDTLVSTLASQLKDIENLHNEQLITDEEYQKMRSEALEGHTSKKNDSNIATITNKHSVPNNLGLNKKLLTAVGAVVGALLLFIVVGFATQTSQDKLGRQVDKAVTNKDASALLKTFSDKDQETAWALPGVSELISNWHDESPSQIVNDLADGRNINTEDDWANVKVTVQSKSHMLFWKTYYLDATPIRVNPESGKDNYVVLTGNGDDENLSRLDDKAREEAKKKVSVSDLESKGVFPGWWIFDIQDDSGNTISTNAYMRSYGRDSSYISMEFN